MKVKIKMLRKIIREEYSKFIETRNKTKKKFARKKKKK